jgi:DNA mismatch endonuclease, patch repair protein
MPQPRRTTGGTGSGRPTYLRDGRAPIPKSEVTSRVMSANKGENTSPEMRLRRSLRANGLSNFRHHLNTIPGRPDVVFPREKLAIFVHGCFWHRCPHCHPSVPKTHVEFWAAKFAANKSRDQRKARDLQHLGWSVLTIWECQLKKNASGAANRVSRRLARLSL